MTLQIPPRLIQTGKNKNLPLLARASAASLKALNTDFEYLFFDDTAVNDFIQTEFPQYRSTFEAFPFRIQKYDFFRYLAVYRLGGFYFDLDIFLASSLQKLLEKGCVFPFEELTINQYLRRQYCMDWEIGNYAFGAAPGHPFLAAVIENCVKAQREPAWVKPMMQGVPRLFQSEFYVLNTSGPGLLSRTLAENPQLANQVTVLFPKDVCDCATWHLFGDFGVHLMEGSWRIQGGYIRRRLGRIWQAWVYRRALAESRQRGSDRHVSELGRGWTAPRTTV